MRHAILGFLVALALFFGVRLAMRGLASDETKIRWVVEDMADGFNDTRMNPILTGLAQDFVDDSTGATKDEARAGIAQLFLQSKDPVTKAFPYRAKLPEDEFKLVLKDGDPRTAAADFLLVCEQSSGEQWSLAWKAKVHAELALDPGGWKIHRTRIDTLEGKRMR